jgi:hypothetical protein
VATRPSLGRDAANLMALERVGKQDHAIVNKSLEGLCCR